MFFLAVLVNALVILNHSATRNAEVLLMFADYKVHIRKFGVALIILFRFICEVPILISILARTLYHSRLSVALTQSEVRLTQVFI